jgi:hypothetical protein
MRDTIIAYFRQKVPLYYPFVYTLFFTGMEAIGSTGVMVGRCRFEAR